MAFVDQFTVVLIGPPKSPIFSGSEQEIYLWLSKRSVVSLQEYGVNHEQTKHYESAAFFMQRVERGMGCDTHHKQRLIPESLVPKFYVMDPKTEDLLRGSALANGMVVLREGPEDRVRLNDLTEDYKMVRALENNRWCTVSEVRRDKNASQLIHFTGVYEDGTKRSRSCNENSGWFVEIASIAASASLATERYNVIESALGDYVVMREDAMNNAELTEAAESTIKKILDQL